MFPVGFYIMYTEAGREYLWTTTVFLGLQALIIFIILLYTADRISVIITTAVILLASYCIEWWGVNSGFPFGTYAYTDVLLPLVNGVPLAITFAWFVVAGSSFLASRFLLKDSGTAAVITVSSALILASDILLEPFASFMNAYWIWDSAAIPMQNFLSWLVLGAVFSIALNGLLKWKEESAIPKGINRYPFIIIAVNLINFSVINIAGGYYVLTIIGFLMFAIVFAVSIKSKLKAS